MAWRWHGWKTWLSNFVLLSAALSVAILSIYLVIRGVTAACHVEKAQVKSEVVTLVAALIALVGLMVSAAALYIIIKGRDIQRVTDLPKELANVVDTLVQSSLYQLPPLAYTQHIPLESLHLFRSLEDIFDSPHFSEKAGGARSKTRRYRESFVRGVTAFCSGGGDRSLQRSIDHFGDALTYARGHREQTEAQWRLGIALRQAGQFDKSLDAFSTLGDTEPGSDSWALGLKGKALTIYARYKSQNRFCTLMWGGDHGPPAGQDALNEALQDLLFLWQRDFTEPQFVPFYAGLIMCEMGLPSVDGPVPVDAKKLLKHTIERSVVGNGNLYPPPDDFAISADFFWSLAICCDLLGVLDPAQRNRCRVRRDRFASAAMRHAVLVAEADEEYKFVYSERFLAEVPVSKFRDHDIREIQWRL